MKKNKLKTIVKSAKKDSLKLKDKYDDSCEKAKKKKKIYYL